MCAFHLITLWQVTSKLQKVRVGGMTGVFCVQPLEMRGIQEIGSVNAEVGCSTSNGHGRPRTVTRERPLCASGDIAQGGAALTQQGNALFGEVGAQTCMVVLLNSETSESQRQGGGPNP